MNIRVFLLLSLLFLGFTGLQSQTRKQKNLETRRLRLQKEIKQVNKLLFNNKEKEKDLLEQIKDINQRMEIRNNLIEVLWDEYTLVNIKIIARNKEMVLLSDDLSGAKDRYSKLIYESYKNRSYNNKWLFLLSSESLEQAYLRLQYTKQHSSYIRKQAVSIQDKKIVIKDLADKLLLIKQDKELLLADYELEKDKIEQEKLSKDDMVLNVKKQRKSYVSQIKKKQKEEDDIDKEIEEIIRLAILKSKKKNKAKGGGFALTPKAKALAKRFASNKGKLPWPVSSGVVVRKYGISKHPTFRGITIKSSGIHIATKSGSMAKSIFGGTV